MDSNRPSKHKRSISGFLSKKLDKALRRSPSPEPPRVPGIRSPSLSPAPSPNDQTSSSLLIQSRSGVEGHPTAHGLVLSWDSITPVPASVDAHAPPAIVISSVPTDPSSADAQANPTTPARTSQGVPSTSSIWAGLSNALRTLQESARVFSPLQSAIGTFISCLEILEEAAKSRGEYEELASELISLTDVLARHMRQSSSARMSDSIANIARAIEDQAKSIGSKRAHGKVSHLLDANTDLDELERHYRRIGSLFRQLQADANLSMWNIVNDQMMNTRLKELEPVKLANYDSELSTGISRRTCTPNTRAAILSGLNDWSKDPDSPDLYWMNGMAGTGKTTIACSFAESLEERKQLAASFFCTRTVPECQKATRIIPTIAYQLARYSIPFQSALCERLSQDPDVGAKNITKQFERLLKAPLLKVKEAIPNDLVVVIDALDECNDMREVELLLSVLLKSAAELPLRFFVTSRPEPEIYKRMLARIQGASATLHLHEVEKSLVQADIELYLAEELEFMSPKPAQIKQLAQRSGNLFIYAATLVRYIRPGVRSVSAHNRLESALAMTSQPHKIHAEIDDLYTAVLKAVFNAEGLEDREIEDLRTVLWTAVCVQEPISIDVLAEITGINDAERVVVAIEALRSVIYFSETSGHVSTLHASFPDFMFDETRSGSFICNLTQHSELVARRCFEMMEAQLKFNICHLDTSFVPDSEVSDLEERVKQTISPSLWYACRYWGDHLRHSDYSDQLCSSLGDFLSVRLLFWMEVLNLKHEIRSGGEILLKTRAWLKIGSVPTELAKLVEDARNFVTSYAANPVAQATPHIYLSSLPFCPKSSSVYQQYQKTIQGLIKITGSAVERRETALLASWKSPPVYSVAYSPNGHQVAIGCQDGTISVRSSYDGTLITGPIQGHTDWVQSVAYSPDGLRIASGSEDTTIRVWSTHDGTLVAGPFMGHTRSIRSIAYSPDGTCVVSCSNDQTIRVWSAHNDTLVAGPFEGHTDFVLSVAYSPDGTHIASGSGDETIQVWTAHDGTPVSSPFKGHTGPVNSVSYSPDGTCIVSGSDDKTIRVWNAHDGALIAGPFEGHTYGVYSVKYSPDGTRIASSSMDSTIRLWGAHDSTLVAAPLQGHTDSIFSIAYSPDGSHILSGSADGTIRVWSTYDGALPAVPYERHTRDVWSVAYSPDGSCIVSGFKGGTIGVWSVHDGTLVASAFEGHTSSVQCVAYSPDGSCIVSGSDDDTIRVWRAHDGEPITSPFQGHAGSVLSVAYSPDGSRIVSGSGDKTIRVWNAQDGTPVAAPFYGHTDSVWSVAYSPDGSSIASGSGDKTIRVYSSHDGTPLASPFEGHTGIVFSVAYSPDGTRIVSGSFDRTIRVWGANSGTLLAQSSEGLAGFVRSVAYSPDGSCIISGSMEKRIQMWSAHDTTLLTSPFEGHTGSVESVAYSPDGLHIASGSADETIRIWRTHTPALIADLTMDHNGVCSTDVTQAPHMPRSPSCPNSDSALADCTIRPDGWVLNTHSELLFWVPPELSCFFSTTRELLVLYPGDRFQVDHDELFLGDVWQQCYMSE